MDLQEAIEHCEDKADCTPCGMEHRQLADWLRKLAAYESTGLNVPEVETLEYLRERYEDSNYDFCGEYGTDECQFKDLINAYRQGLIRVPRR